MSRRHVWKERAVNTRYLKEFLVIAEELNFSAAAKRLYTTRPTLSEHLAELEDELGCKLVERGRGKPALTPLGRRFLGTASDLLGQWDEVVGEYRDLSDNLLTVTVSATNLPWLEAPLLRARHRIVEKWPEGKIDIVTDNGPLATVDALGERKNDIVVVGCKSFSEAGHRLLTKEHPGFVLNAETTHLFMTEDNPLLGRDTICAADLDGAVLLLPPDVHQSYERDGVADRFAANGARITLKTMPFRDHAEYFAHDFGCAIGVAPDTLVPRFGLDRRPGLRLFDLDDMDFSTDFIAVFRDEFVESPHGRVLFDEMKAAVAQGEPAA